MDDKTHIELEAAVYRRLIEHLRQRTDVKNIKMMNLAGFSQLPVKLDEGRGRRLRRTDE